MDGGRRRLGWVTGDARYPCSASPPVNGIVAAIAAITLGVALDIPDSALGARGTTERVSVTNRGRQAGGASRFPALSANGRFVVFSSWARLEPGDLNLREDVYVRDRRAHRTFRVSVNSRGQGARAGSCCPQISADGRFVVFRSAAGNLVQGDTNRALDVFVHDRRTGKTERISVTSGSGQGNGPSTAPYISGNGRYVAFASDATNLVAGDGNRVMDAFVRDRWTRTTRRISVSSAGAQGNALSHPSSISASGRFVAFASDATNLVPDDTNGRSDAFVHDRRTHRTSRVSVGTGGRQGVLGSYRPSLSANGRYVAFRSWSRFVSPDRNDEADAFVHDRWTGRTQCVSVNSLGRQGLGRADRPWISSSGRYIAFRSAAANLVARDTNGVGDIFVHDRITGITIRVSVGPRGAQANRTSSRAVISADGRVVTFTSAATNLVADDTNRTTDIFVRVIG